MENDAKLATENQKIPNRFTGLTGAFQQRLSIMWTKIFMRANNPLVRVSLTLWKRKAINNKASRRQRWIPNAIAGWAVLLNNHICVFRDLSHGSCLFFFPSPNCQLYQWWKWKMYHSKLFFLFAFSELYLI